ncbi:primosomal protein N' [bacterium]|nr:primosomal protein N' [bacterium]
MKEENPQNLKLFEEGSSPSNLHNSPRYALALVNITGLGVKTFSYLIPDEMKAKLQIGQAILVPFGRQGLINAFCVGFSNYLPGDFKVKKISRILDETPLFSIDYLKLLEWVANYYCCDLVTVLNAAIPMKLIEKASKTELAVEFASFEGATKRQVEVLELLKTSGKMPLIMFEKMAKTTRTTVKKLEALGCLKLTEENIYRNPLDILKISEKEPLFELSGEQRAVYEGIRAKINPSPQPSPARGEGEFDENSSEISTCVAPERSECKARHFYTEKSLEYSKELRKNMTDVENILWYYLCNKQLGGYKFRRQEAIDNYIADFVCYERKLIIELDGGQHNEQKNIQKDKNRQKYLEDKGFTVLRFWNNDVIENIESVLNKIYETILETPKNKDIPDKNSSHAPSPPAGEGWGEGSTPPTILLHGVTASGKTEVYFKLIKDCIDAGKNVLFLAPEIALASQLTKRLAKKFGTEDVAIWHSSISDGERYDVWQKLYKNEIKILAGARSAVFAPLKNIGLIIIDEEHESAYKQTSPAPRYDAKVVAQKLSEFHNCPLLLGSATPDISSYYRAVNTNNLFELKKRFNDAKVPPVTVINMQEYGRAAYKNVISIPLQNAIKETLEKKQQVILLINRRGFSTFTQCKACGHVIECPNCAIPMIWHSKDQMLKCHYCNHTEYFPDFCPECGSDALRNSGTGTQKIEQYIKDLFPENNIERIDSDILVRKGEHIRLLERFQNGDIDILVGTQMIAKGLDNPNVTLVGVISADASFNLPDFRASERGFQLLTQVAGRAGRGEFSGKVYFQTYNPDYYALASAKSQNYDEFYATEIIAREEFDYPPFSQIVRLVLSSQNNFRAEKSAQEIALRLCTMVEKFGISERLEILGPTPCVIERINSMYRFQIIIKNKMGEKGHQFVSSFLGKITMPKDIKLAIDVDPLDIL